MQERFDAVEVLKIAEQIENDAVTFYHSAWARFDDPELKKTFLELAEWEKEHHDFFRDMREKITGTAVLPFDTEESDYKALAALNVFSNQPRRPFSKNILPDEAIKAAVKNERETIAFYKGLKKFAIDTETVLRLDKIIEEEKKHITILNGLLEKS